MRQNSLPNVEPDVSCAFENAPMMMLFILTDKWEHEEWQRIYCYLQGLKVAYVSFNNVSLNDTLASEIDFLMHLLLTKSSLNI